MAIETDVGVVTLPQNLFQSLGKSDLTAYEQRVLNALVYFTYGANQQEAQIGIEDIRYYLGASPKLRTDRLSAALVKLIEQKVVIETNRNGEFFYSIEKNTEKWFEPDKLSVHINVSSNLKLRSSADKMSKNMSTPDRLLAYTQTKCHVTLSLGAYKKELKACKALYIEVLSLTREPLTAVYLIKDFIDQDEWMQKNVRMVFTYITPRFKAWYDQIPSKPREIRENEEALGKRFRYNTKAKKWEVA